MKRGDSFRNEHSYVIYTHKETEDNKEYHWFVIPHGITQDEHGFIGIPVNNVDAWLLEKNFVKIK